jgi:C-terminal processing protease CtpA/Prc
MSQAFRSWWRAAAGGLLTAAVLFSGIGLRAAADDDAAKTDQPRKEQPKADDARKDDARADQHIQKQLDQMRRDLEEMHRFMDQMGGTMPDLFLGGGRGEQQVFYGLGGFGQLSNLGVGVRSVDPILAEQLNPKKGEGLVVAWFLPDSPAEKAGIKRHDVLVEVNGKSVPGNWVELARMLAEVKPDTPVDVTVIRKGKPETIKGLKLREGPAEVGPRPRGTFGVVVRPADDTLAEQLGLKKDQGLVVERVMPDSPAEKGGIKPHDVLVEVNGKGVTGNWVELARMLAEVKPDTPVDVTVIRKAKPETIKGVKLREGPPEGKAPPPGI